MELPNNLAFMTNEFGTWNNALNTPITILMRRAQMGDPSAIKEMALRGMEAPPVAVGGRGIGRTPTGRSPAFEQSGRGGVPPVSPLGLERPAYLDRGPSTDAPTPGLARNPYETMYAMPGLEQPPYLQRGTSRNMARPAWDAPDEPTPDQRLAAVADGGDAAGAIQAGTQAALDVSGETSPADIVKGPLAPLAQAMSDADDVPDDQYGATIDQIIAKLMAGQDPAAMRSNALAQAGFAMAASGSPTFFGAVGVGGQTGLKAYQQAQEQDMANRVRAAELAGQRSTFKENVRAHRADEQHATATLGETQAENLRRDERERAQQAEIARHNKVIEAYNQGALQVSRSNASVALGNLKVSQADLEEKKRQFDAGQATEQELRVAEIALRKAQAKSYETLGVDRNTDIIETQDGGAAIVDKSSGKSVPIVDEQGNPIKVMPKTRGSAGRYTSELDVIKAANTAKANIMRLHLDPVEGEQAGQAEWQRIYDEGMSSLQPSAASPADAPGAPTPSAAPPAGRGAAITPKTQAEIDNAPSGTRMIINGKTYVKP